MDLFGAPSASNCGVNAYLLRGSMIAMDKPTKHAQSLLRLALDEAVEDDLIENNPLAG